MKRIHSSGSSSWTLLKLNAWRFGLSSRRCEASTLLHASDYLSVFL